MKKPTDKKKTLCNTLFPLEKGYTYKLHNRRVHVRKIKDLNGNLKWILRYTIYYPSPKLRKRDCIMVTRLALSDEAMRATLFLYEIINNENSI